MTDDIVLEFTLPASPGTQHEPADVLAHLALWLAAVSAEAALGPVRSSELVCDPPDHDQSPE